MSDNSGLHLFDEKIPTHTDHLGREHNGYSTSVVVDMGVNVNLNASKNTHLHYDVQIDPYGIGAAQAGNPGWNADDVQRRADGYEQALREGLQGAGYQLVKETSDSRGKTLHFQPQGGEANRDDGLFIRTANQIIDEHNRQKLDALGIEVIMPPHTGNGQPRELTFAEALDASRTHADHMSRDHHGGGHAGRETLHRSHSERLAAAREESPTQEI